MNRLEMVRNMSATPEFVFDSFTKPDMMRAWWNETTTFSIDLRVDGEWVIERTEGQKAYTARGEYLQIDRPHKLQYTYSMPQFSPNTDIITLIIAEKPDGGCVATFTEIGVDIEAEVKELAPGVKSDSEKGWQQAFDLIELAWHNQGGRS